MRNMTLLKHKHSIEFLPTGMDEETLTQYLKDHPIEVILLPWHLYFKWKKTSNLSTIRVVGYFADPLLHFEFQSMPNFKNVVLLDFYHFKIVEIEILMKFLKTVTEEMEVIEVFGKKVRLYQCDWLKKDRDSTGCIDQIFANSILKSRELSSRIPDLRLYLTALWLISSQEKHFETNISPMGHVVMAEYQHRLLLQFSYFSQSLTTKDILREIWPSHSHSHALFKELVRHSDFIKFNHFPESRKFTITSLFLPQKPTSPHPGEVRGFWIETRL